VGILLLIGILIHVLFDPISSVKHNLEILRVHNKSPNAREKWDAQKIANYRFEIQGAVPLICLPHAVIEVRNHAVVKVETITAEGLRSLSPDKWSDPDWGEEVFLCDYSNFTMTQFFGLIDRAFQNDPSVILSADFDPDYGFVATYSYGLFVGHGLLSPKISECCGEFSISKFEPLQP